ncbi:Mut7-C RNAse domain-containing protein [Desulfospira joergensenii]|uniref:Mut7-C RNAse domain-containing protein n=1 Tax=Desulfospira joergensenii TaxID=53329 RepID=UPI0003B3FBC2|nr:Mut7-C RNAse domain-containing protein [Desulfospira joergensenii]
MRIYIRFSEDLDFFLKKEQQGRRFALDMDRKASVKDIIESQGVPHTEVGRMELEKQTRDFAFIPGRTGALDVSGIKPPFDVLKPGFLRPRPLARIRFVADVNVMKLGKLMLLLGFDTACSSSFSDPEIADISEREKRIVLTRDTGLLKRKKIEFGRRIRSNLPYEQLEETLVFFGLSGKIRFFTRCSHCNKSLEPRDKADVMALLEPKTQKYFSRFFQCPECKKVFWKGSHYAKIVRKLGTMEHPVFQEWQRNPDQNFSRIEDL